MKKRNLVLIGSLILAVVIIFTATTTFASNGQNPWERLWQIVVTNWPENQNVTVTNKEPIKVEGIGGGGQEKNYKTVLLGANEVYVGGFIPLPNPWQKTFYASYEGKGKLDYMTVSGPNQVGVYIDVDGENVAFGDAFNICQQWGQRVGDGWKCFSGNDPVHNFGALEITQDYYFNNKIEIYLSRGSYTGPAGAHIELLVEE